MAAQLKLSLKREEVPLALPRELAFKEHVGSIFEVVDFPPSPFELMMTKVVEHAKSEHQEAFSVFFLGPADRFMPQGTRKIKNEQLGELEVFLVPVGKTDNGFEYEAAFNYMLMD